MNMRNTLFKHASLWVRNFPSKDVSCIFNDSFLLKTVSLENNFDEDLIRNLRVNFLRGYPVMTEQIVIVLYSYVL